MMTETLIQTEISHLPSQKSTIDEGKAFGVPSFSPTALGQREAMPVANNRPNIVSAETMNASLRPNESITIGNFTPPTAKKPTTTAEWLGSSYFKNNLSAIIPKNLSVERICRIALTELRKNPALQQCAANSFLWSVMEATKMGLEIGGVLGHAYLIPRKGICEFMIGYKGMIELANRAHVLVTANLVYENDEFYAEFGNNEQLKHVVKPGNRDKYLSAYAYMRTKENTFKMYTMLPEEITAVMKKAPNYTSPNSAWVKDFSAMAKKTVIRQLFKFFPISDDLTRAIALEELREAGIPQDDFTLEIEA